MKNYYHHIISDIRTDRDIVVCADMVLDRCAVYAVAHDDIETAPFKKMTFNKSDVVRINKSSISTCDIDMLVHVLANNIDVFNIVYWDITRIQTATKYHITKAQFYNSFNNDLDSFAAFFNNADFETRRTIIFDHCCTDHNAKMRGMISYSTCVLFNRFCVCRMKKDAAVCKHCFAARQLGIYADQLNKLKRAHAIATRCTWSADDIPVSTIAAGNYKYFRLESFGDLNNETQIQNYNTLAAALAAVNIGATLWTKNPGIVQTAINNGMELSNNLVIGLSSLELNKPEIDKARRYSFIRFVFTVFDRDYIREHNININCGGRHCLSCLNCYKHAKTADDLIVINEMLK